MNTSIHETGENPDVNTLNELKTIQDRMKHNNGNLYFDHWSPIYELIGVNVGDKITLSPDPTATKFPTKGLVEQTRRFRVQGALPKKGVSYKDAKQDASLVDIYFVECDGMRTGETHIVSGDTWKDDLREGDHYLDIHISTGLSSMKRLLDNPAKTVGKVARNIGSLLQD